MERKAQPSVGVIPRRDCGDEAGTENLTDSGFFSPLLTGTYFTGEWRTDKTFSVGVKKKNKKQHK